MNKNNLAYPRAVKLIGAARRVGLISHEYTDGDDLGAMLAMKLGLDQLKIESSAIALGALPEKLFFLPGISEVKQESSLSEFDLAILFGCSEFSRTGIQNWPDKNFLTINIDHHPDNKLYADVNLVDSQAAATSELAYYLLSRLNARITKPIAINLLTGIFFDTGGFQHANTSAEILEVAAELMRRGARVDRISQYYFGKSGLPKLKVWARALDNARFDSDQQMVYSVITEEELNEAGGTFEDLEGVVSVLNTIPEAKFSLLLKQRGDEIKGSLRSEHYKGTDVSAIARVFGGGGHKLSAAFKIKGKIEKTKDGWKIT